MGYSRRRFLAHLSLGLGSLMAGPGLSALGRINSFLKKKGVQELPDKEKLNIALVGLGSYATGQLAPALQETKLCKLNGIVTGTPQKEQLWARKYDIPEDNIYDYETFNQIADNNSIDIIYIVLPNGMHGEYTIRSAQAGKHVICEKPMATSVEDCQRMIDACNKADKKLSIGYRIHFEPHHKRIMQIGRDQVFGSVQQMNGGFGFPFNDLDSWRLDQELSGGGPLMDVGIYAVQAAMYSMGKLPTSVSATDKTRNSSKFKEVEGTLHWDLTFPDGIHQHGKTSYEESHNNLRVDAENGWAQVNPAFSYSGIRGTTSNGSMDFPQVNQQMLQMDDFARCILEDDQTIVPGEMGKRDVRILYAIYQAAETGNEVELNFENDAYIRPLNT